MLLQAAQRQADQSACLCLLSYLGVGGSAVGLSLAICRVYLQSTHLSTHAAVIVTYIYCSTATFCTGHILYMHFWFSQSHFFLRASGAQTQRSKPCGPRRCGRRTWSQIIFLTLGEPADDSACRICQEHGVPCCPACESAPRAPVQHKWRLIEHVLFDYYARVYQALACLWRLLFSG